ncbi:MAG: cellulase family glycosylhydrolase [Deltaproteobacteria bacterium]|nr:cellulase family glycosylhydrolase [Deltaproteobacteria bacterium]
MHLPWIRALSTLAALGAVPMSCGPTHSRSSTSGGGLITGSSSGSTGAHVDSSSSTGTIGTTGHITTATSTTTGSSTTAGATTGEGASTTTTSGGTTAAASTGSAGSGSSTGWSGGSSGSTGHHHGSSSSSSTTTGTSTSTTTASSTTASSTTASSTTTGGSTASSTGSTSSTTASSTTASSTTTGGGTTSTTASSTTTGTTASSTTTGGTTTGSTGTASSGWLHTAGNHIYNDDGTIWHARGANIADTRGCNACAYNSPDVNEVIRRIDELTDVWHANFMRLDMESYASAGGRVTWADVLQDPSYLNDIQTIVAHVESKQNVYIMLSLWVDPTFTTSGWPTTATGSEWTLLAQTFKDDPHVLYGLVNEPQNNYDGSQDAQVWTAMNNTVANIRAAEDAAGTPHHIVAAQGTGGWSRRLGYYVTHPITAGNNGDNIAYEVHVYDPQANFQSEWVTPAATIPVIIGEFGPASGYMTMSDCSALMTQAEQLEVPYLAWTFHMRCDPNLLVDNSGGGCGVGMTLTPTSWGTLLKNQLANPY